MTTTITGSRLKHAIGADGLFSLSLRDGSARLRAVDGATVRIRDLHDHDLEAMFAIGLGDGSASLRAMRQGDLGRGDRGHAPDLEIEIPRRATVVFEAASGEVEAEGLTGDQRYRTTSGDVTLRSVSGRIAIDAVSGDVDIAATGEAALTVRTVSGDVELRAGILTSLEAATTSGDLKIAGRLAGPGPFGIVTVSGDALLAPAGDLRIEMATLSGDLHSEFDGVAEGGRGRRSLWVGSGGPVINVRSLSGDLNVVRPISGADPIPAAPTAPAAPVAPAAPADPADPAAPAAAATPKPVEATHPTALNGALEAAYDEARLRILQSLERGEIDVAEAGRRLETLEGADPDPSAETTRVSTAEPADA
jgi:putative adhesin